MNLRDLQYLVAIEELKHFGKAATRCHISQPTLSGQLKKLEEYLGVQLVERNNRQVLLTEVGQEIASRAKILLREARNIEELAQSYANPMSGRVRTGLIPTVAPYLLPLVMDPIRNRFPDLELTLLEGQTAELVAQLHEGELDLLILALGVAGTEGFDALHLFDEPFCLAVPSSHALANHAEVTMDDLHDQRVLLLQDGHCLRGQALDVCFSAGAQETEGFRATSIETLRHMVAAGAGLTLIPQLAVPDLAAVGVHYLPFAAPAPARQIGLLYRSHTSRRACFRALAGTIREAVTPRLKGL